MSVSDTSQTRIRETVESVGASYFISVNQNSHSPAHIHALKTCRLTYAISFFQTKEFLELLPKVRERIIDIFTPKALDVFKREFDFFDKVTSISGVLFPLPKEERRAGIRRY